MTNLRHHETLSNLLQDDDLGSSVSRHDGNTLSNMQLDIADPRIFMISDTIWNTIRTSFEGLESNLKSISTSMERIASDPSSYHAHRADVGISTRAPRARGVPSPTYHASSSADGSPTPSSKTEGGDPPDGRGQEAPQGDEDIDAVSLHPRDDTTFTTREKQIQSFPRYVYNTL